jgi:hypothetical protein
MFWDIPEKVWGRGLARVPGLPLTLKLSTAFKDVTGKEAVFRDASQEEWFDSVRS